MPQFFFRRRALGAALGFSCALSACSIAQTAAPDGRILVEAQTKLNQPWQFYPTRTLEILPGYTPVAAPVETDIYGGWPQIKAKATGFFYATKISNRFWLIDPLGNGFINKAVVSVAPGGSANMKANLQTKYGSPEKWAAATTQMLRDNGFNGIGAWSDDALLRGAPTRLAYTRIWNFMSSYGKKRGGTKQLAGHTGYPKNAIFVFDPEFETFCDQHAQQLAATKDDPYLLGHYSDNEMPWPKKSLSAFLSLPAADPGHVAAQGWKDEHVKGEITDAHEEAFRGVVADRYFSIVSKAIKKYDPNHLYLGSRFHSSELFSPAVIGAAGKYLDVMSVNYYGNWTPETRRMDNWMKWSGKPFLITEWYAKGADSGLKNDSGAGWLVRTQQDRGLFYQNSPYAVGLW